MTTKLTSGDIVLVPAPYSDLTQKKYRPALVLSSFKFNSTSQDVILVAISSNLTRDLDFEIPILVTDSGFSDTGLHKSSVIKCGAIFAYRQDFIERQLGKLPSSTLTQVQQKVKEILNI